MYKFSLLEQADLPTMTRIQMEAYPAISQNVAAELYGERIWAAHNQPNVDYYGAFREEKINRNPEILEREPGFFIIPAVKRARRENN
jgi:hypothetical protein